MKGRVLIIAGSDSGGGAGIQADIKSITALNSFAMSAVTALTAQNTQGVYEIEDVPTSFIEQQISVVLSDIGADSIKIGMLNNVETIEIVSSILEAKARDIPIILDPVMVAKGGASLIEKDAVQALKELLIPKALILTPNIPEAEALTGMLAGDIKRAEYIGKELFALGPKTILLKGGHRPGETVVDLFMEKNGSIKKFETPRLNTKHTHGTGCTLASAIAAGVAQGLSLNQSVKRAIGYVHEAIRTAPGFGSGHGPLNHSHTVRAMKNV